MSGLRKMFVILLLTFLIMLAGLDVLLFIAAITSLGGLVLISIFTGLYAKAFGRLI